MLRGAGRLTHYVELRVSVADETVAMTGLETPRLLPAHLDQPAAVRVVPSPTEVHDDENIAIPELANLDDLVDRLVGKVF